MYKRQADDLAKKATAAGVLIRAGFDPEAAMVTLQRPEDTRSVDKTLPNTVGLSDGSNLDRLEALTERLAGMREARGHERE